MIDAVILAGGLGTRLQEKVPSLPKALAPIQGVPFLKLLLQQLASFSLLGKVILALGYKASAIQNFLETEDHFPFSIEVSEEFVPLGTGGALIQAATKTETDSLLVLNGDTFFDLPFFDFYETHRKNQAVLTIACRKAEEGSRYGTLQLDASQRVLAFQEKSGSTRGWINGGIYLMQRSLLKACQAGCCSLEFDLFPKFLQNATFAYPSSGIFVDIGTPSSYEEAQKMLQPWIPR